MVRKVYHFYKNYRYPDEVKHFKLLRQAEEWSLQEIDNYQQNQLVALLRVALGSNFYRSVIEMAGLNLESFTSDQLIKLPILTRDMIRDRVEDLLTGSTAGKGVYQNRTGGSTGQPISFWQDQYYQSTALAGLAYGFYLCGYRSGNKQLFIWGSDYDSQAHQKVVGRLYDWLNNSSFINAFNMGEGALKETAQLITKWQPKFIWSYVSSIELIARYLKSNNIYPTSVQSVQTTAETLQQPTRDLMESTFGARVFDRYGSREVSLIAHECFAQKQAMHILPLNNYIELVDANNQPVKTGEIGKILVTNLNNQIMPLIRYDIGDLAKLKSGQCGCGRNWPMIEKIMGRKTDIIYSPSGKYIHGEFFTHLFYKLNHVRQFQVEQKTRTRLVIRIVKDKGFEDRDINFLREIITQEADAGFELEFEFPEKIVTSDSGKFRFTFSQIKHPLSQI